MSQHKTTSQKVEEYIGCFEAGETISIHLFTEAYPSDEVKASLISLRHNDKIRMVAVGLVREYCDRVGCQPSDLIKGENETFGYIEVL